MKRSSQKQYKLLLINPAIRYRYYWDLYEVSRILGKKSISLPLSLPLLASLTPDHWDVKIIDENTTKLPQSTDATLIGITGYLNNIERAYEIADFYRNKGIRVCMGGPQVSNSIDEALQHADFVVLNEVEGVWKKALIDVENNTIKSVYRAEKYCDFQHSPLPRWDLVNTSDYLSFSVQVSRGCPYKCEFCSVRDMFGEKQRYRKLDNVIDEIKALPAHGVISFADDNLTADRNYLKEFLKKIKPLNKIWNCQASIDIAYDKDLVSQMADAGCSALLVGIESLDMETISGMGKKQNKVNRYEEAVSNVHKNGIHLIASFIVGFDNDKPETLDRIYKFSRENKLSYVMINSLNAFPGTEFEKKMRAQDRVFTFRQEYANGIFPTIKFKNFSQKDIFYGILNTLERIYDYDNLRQNAVDLFSDGKFNKQAKKTSISNQVGIKTKLKTTLIFIKWFVFEKDRKARKFLWELMRLIRSGKAESEVVIQYILFVESVKGYFKSCWEQEGVIINELEKRDAMNKTANK